MADCTLYYDAIDQDGDPMPFTCRFFLFHYVSGEWKYYSTYHISPGVSESMTLTKGDKYRGEAVDYDGWKTPNRITITACQKDFTFKYEKEDAEGDIRNAWAIPTSQHDGQMIELMVQVKNVGSITGTFKLIYYEHVTPIATSSNFTVRAGSTVTQSRIFEMPNRDFPITIKLYRVGESQPDDIKTVIVYLIGKNDYYVKTDGNDSNSGATWADAWKTIDKAARTIPDGTTLHIGFGYYGTEPPDNKITPQKLGAKGIQYKPETPNSQGGTGTVIIEKN